MKAGLLWLKLLVLATCLGGMPAEAALTWETIILSSSYDYGDRGAYQTAINNTDEQAQRRTELQDQAADLFQRGSVAHQAGQYQEALGAWQSALALYRELNNRQGEANTLGNLGLVYDSIGESQRAVDFHQRQLTIAKEIGDHQGEANALGNLGNVFNRLGSYQQAIDFYQQQLAITRETFDRRGEARALGNSGSAYSNLGEQERAIDFHHQSLTIAREIDDRQGEANSLGNLGITYYRLGEYRQAIDFSQQSSAIVREIGDRKGEAALIGNVGAIYFGLGEYERAIDFYQQSLAIAREIGFRQSEADSLGNLGVAYFRQGEYERAIDFHHQSLAIAREIGNHQSKASSLGNLGAAYESIGEYHRAIDFYQQSLTIKEEIDDHQGKAISLNNLGIVHLRLGESHHAIDFLEKALVTARRTSNRENEALALNNMGVAWETQGRPEIASVFYKRAINIHEIIREGITGLEKNLQSSYIASVEDPYLNLIDILLEQGRILEAQRVLELMKIEELREFTRATYSNGQLQYNDIEQSVVDAHDTLIKLGAQISACDPVCDPDLETQLESLEIAFDATIKAFEETIRENRGLDSTYYDPTSLASDALDIVNAQDGTVLIYPVVLEDTLWILWTATNGVVGSIEVSEVTRADLSRAAVHFRELLNKPDSQSLSELKTAGQQLYGWLIEPLAAEFETNGIKHLVFAQDRVTRYLPMSALYDGEQFLLENYTISTVLSAALTDTTERLGPADAANTLGLGLEQPIGGFNALPNVREELETVIRENDEDKTGIYPGSVFLNEDFTFSTLSQQVRRHRILHIASHAQFVPNAKDASYILSGTGEELTIDQIGALDTKLKNLHLVVLSACQTALGGEFQQNGTEIAGVSSYFLGPNKAEAVLATLWRVDDAGTSLLMQRFYEFMATGELTKAEALRQAQLSLLNSEASLDERFATLGLERGGLVSANESSSTTTTLDHPYYWAPFILIGNHL